MTDSAQALDVRSVGERIERLLDASAASGPVARERAEELVRLLAELYGAGLERLLTLTHEAGALSEELLATLAGDELVSSLLLVHGLHPYSVTERVAAALDSVRPYLGTHGGDVELLDVTPDGVARLRMLGSCDGCASSAVTLELAVREAIEAAAPEVERIEVAEDTQREAARGGVIPVDSLSVRLHDDNLAASAQWEPIEDLDDLPPGGLRCVMVGGLDLIVACVDASLLAYRDRCAACSSSLRRASIERRLGEPGSAVLTCPQCRAHFDLRRAGAGIDDKSVHLEPLPLLQRNGIVEVAVPRGAAA